MGLHFTQSIEFHLGHISLPRIIIELYPTRTSSNHDLMLVLKYSQDMNYKWFSYLSRSANASLGPFDIKVTRTAQIRDKARGIFNNQLDHISKRCTFRGSLPNEDRRDEKRVKCHDCCIRNAPFAIMIDALHFTLPCLSVRERGRVISLHAKLDAKTRKKRSLFRCCSLRASRFSGSL